MEWYQEKGRAAAAALMDASGSLDKARTALLNLYDSPYNDKDRRDNYYKVVEAERIVNDVEDAVRRMMRDYHYGPQKS